MKATLTLALGMVALAGCATLFNEDTKAIGLVSVPAAAEVWIDNVQRGVTPLTLNLDNHTSHTVTFRKDGHRDVVCNLSATTETKWIVLDVLGGLIPIIVDASTGAWKSVEQDSCNVTLPEMGGVRSTGLDGRVRYFHQPQ